MVRLLKDPTDAVAVAGCFGLERGDFVLVLGRGGFVEDAAGAVVAAPEIGEAMAPKSEEPAATDVGFCTGVVGGSCGFCGCVGFLVFLTLPCRCCNESMLKKLPDVNPAADGVYNGIT